MEGGEDLYREIRIENTLIDKDGTEVSLRPGSQVEVTIEAEPKETVKKQPGSPLLALRRVVAPVHCSRWQRHD